MDTLAFTLLGIISGIGASLLFFRFDTGWLKALSFSGGSAILIGEFAGFSEFFDITSENKSTVFSAFLGAWIVTFLIALPIMLRILKNQESKYKIHTWEILLGDKKTIDDYYNLKRDEIKKLLEEELNIESLKRKRNEIEEDRNKLSKYKKSLEEERKLLEELSESITKQCHLTIPISYKLPITNKYFEILPSHLYAVSDFYHQITSFTDDFIGKIDNNLTVSTKQQLFRSYLLAMGYYIGELLFNWKEVRVHFRRYEKNSSTYESYLAIHNNGQEYKQALTSMPSDKGLIFEAYCVKRSLVKSANRRICIESNNDHIWKDYITMVFDRICYNEKPLLSLGISVKHNVYHKDMLYFLSFIQIEQVIQDNLLKINDKLLINEILEEIK